MRTITVLSTTKGEPVTLTSEATNWAQLKDALKRDFPQVESMRATIKGLMTDLIAGEAQLPEGDFVMYLTPQKIKGGLSITSIAKIYAEAQAKMWRTIANKLEGESLSTLEEEDEDEEEFEDDYEDDDEDSKIDSADLDAMRKLSGY